MGKAIYKNGSLGELWSVSFPLMLSSFSVVAMVFVDRAFLSNYHLLALNAAISAESVSWIFIFSWTVLASSVEILISFFKGSSEKQKMGETVWQMLWLSFFSLLFFLPIATMGADFIYGFGAENAMEKIYFQCIVLFGPVYPLQAALSGFFIGQGKTTIVTKITFFSNILNGFLDYFFIFGVEGWIEPLGIQGAALATGISYLIQILFLSILFLKEENKQEFGVDQWKFNKKTFYHCIKLTSPQATYVFIEMVGWATFFFLVGKLGEKHMTIASIGQTVAIFFYFFAESISRGGSILFGNFLGEKKPEFIPQVILNGIRMHFAFFSALLLLLVPTGSFLIQCFLTDEETLATLSEPLMISLYGVLFYLFFEGIRLLLSMVLRASGDTVYLLASGSFSLWLFLVLPTYLLTFLENPPLFAANFILVFYSLGATSLYFLRFKQEKWRTADLTPLA